MSPVVQLRPPTAKKPTVRRVRAKNRGRAENKTYRTREYLTEAEIEKLLTAAGKSRNPNRDRLLVLMAYRHALRVKELVDLQVDQIDLKAATIHIRRAKNGTPGIHGLQGDELRLIRALVRENGTHCRYLFISERGAPLSIDGAQNALPMARRRPISRGVTLSILPPLGGCKRRRPQRSMVTSESALSQGRFSDCMSDVHVCRSHSIIRRYSGS